jgi:hypothetical protein
MPRQMLYPDRRQLFQNDADRVLPQFISEPLRRSQHQAVPIFDGKVDGFQGMLMPITYFLFSRAELDERMATGVCTNYYRAAPPIGCCIVRRSPCSSRTKIVTRLLPFRSSPAEH